MTYQTWQHGSCLGCGVILVPNEGLGAADKCSTMQLWGTEAVMALTFGFLTWVQQAWPAHPNLRERGCQYIRPNPSSALGQVSEAHPCPRVTVPLMSNKKSKRKDINTWCQLRMRRRLHKGGRGRQSARDCFWQPGFGQFAG